MPPINHKAEIEAAASQAVKTIKDSAEGAAHQLAVAASDAVKVVADAAKRITLLASFMGL